MSLAEAEFWRECDEYHEFAEEFERNIEITHPDYVTSRGMCVCLMYGVGQCSWAATSVKYVEHRG